MIPDIIGYRLDEASSILARSGVKNFTLRLAMPPGASPAENNSSLLRVLRVSRAEDGRAEIIACNSGEDNTILNRLTGENV